MAGIGFDLRRLVTDDSGLLSRLRAYASAAMITAGPWIATMASLAAIHLARQVVGSDVAETFLAVASYVFAGSLVTVGALQMTVTRWLADKLFLGQYDRVAAGFGICLLMVAAVQSLTGAIAAGLLGMDADLAAAAVLAYVAVSMSWFGMIWLSVVRMYDRILAAFLLGMLAFWTLVLALREPDAAALVSAFGIGYGLTVALMVGIVLRGVTAPAAPALEVLTSVVRYRSLAVLGAVCALALWSDKLVFWWLEGESPAPGLRNHPLYDGCFFLGYLTAIPALAINLVHLETGFYEHYRRYYDAITGDRPLTEIRNRRAEMVRVLRNGLVHLLRYQAFVTLACIVFASPIVSALDMPPFAARVLRFACLGAAFHALLLVAILLLLYFDLRREALTTAVVFLVANVTFALLSVSQGPATYGLGPALAGLIALTHAVVVLRRSLEDLEFLTFMRQPAVRG